MHYSILIAATLPHQHILRLLQILTKFESIYLLSNTLLFNNIPTHSKTHE